MKKTLLTLITVTMVLAAGIISGCTASQRPARMSEEVIIGSAFSILSSLVVVAMDQGFFSQEGLIITIKDYPSGKRAFIEGFSTGELDVLTSSGVPIVINSFERQDFSIVAIIGISDDEPKIIARKDRGIQRPEDLLGKHIATQLGSSVHFFLHMFLVDNGISDKNIKLSNIKAEKLPEALASGEIDAFCMREPFISQAKELLGDNAVIFSKPGLFYKTHNLVVRNNLIKDKPEVVEKILKALLKAEQFVESHPDQAITIVSNKLGMEESEVAVLWSKTTFELSLNQGLLTELEDEARWAMGSDLVAETEIPNYLNYIHVETLEGIKPHAVTIIR